MRTTLTFLTACFVATTMAEDTVNHRFDPQGAHLPDGFPEHAPLIIVVAGKPVSLHFSGVPVNWQQTVQLHRVTAARKVQLDAPTAEATADGWQWTWTPPKTRGPAHYEVRFDGEPKRLIRIESRDPEWLKATLEMLGNAKWEGQGLSADELAALGHHGLRTGKSPAAGKDSPASLQLLPNQGDAARRRVVWDQENPGLIVWRPGPAAGDLEVRAPRWWISAEALATDQGLIRFLDLFSEPPRNP